MVINMKTVSARVTSRALVLCGCALLHNGIVQAEQVFEDNFDRQPDWHSELAENDKGGVPSGEPDTAQYQGIHTIPQGWHAVRQDPVWSPVKGHSDRHPVIEILSSNADKAKGQTGKSFVTWRDSYDPGWNRFNSDGILFYRLPGDGLEEVYVEFWATFSDQVIESFYGDLMGSSKLLRIMSHDAPDDFSYRDWWNFFEGNHKPMYVWGTGGETVYGIRNYISIYRAAGGEPLNDNIEGLPQRMQSGGDNSLWYSPTATDGQGVDGSDPALPDYRNGGVIESGPVGLDQLFGKEQTWVKVGQYVKLNSAPGVADGELHHYLGGQRILHLTGIEWVTSGQPMKKWNLVAIGGNDFFQGYANELRHEEWYAIDDFAVYSSLPDSLTTNLAAPNPPSSLSVE